MSVLFIHPGEFGLGSAVDESHCSGCFPPLVAVMKATDSGQSDDLGLWRRSVLGGAPHRGIPKLCVDPVGVVVFDVFAEQASKVVLVHDDHVIEQFFASTPDPSLGNPILPGASKSRPPRLDSDLVDHLSHPV